MSKSITIKKIALNIETNSIYYILLISNPFYKIDWKYMYAEYIELREMQFITVILEPYPSSLVFRRIYGDLKLEYAFNYRIFGCDFFAEKRFHTPIKDYLYDEIRESDINNIEYVLAMIYNKHKTLLEQNKNKKGLNIISKTFLRKIL